MVGRASSVYHPPSSLFPQVINKHSNDNMCDKQLKTCVISPWKNCARTELCNQFCNGAGTKSANPALTSDIQCRSSYTHEDGQCPHLEDGFTLNLIASWKCSSLNSTRPCFGRKRLPLSTALLAASIQADAQQIQTWNKCEIAMRKLCDNRIV